MRGNQPAVACLVLVLLGFAAERAAAQDPAAPKPAAAQTEPEPTPRVSFGASADYVSTFVWRGFLTSDMPCLQPSAWSTIGPLTVTSWVNLERHGSVDYSFAEHDLSVEYTRDVGGFSVTAGWINYFFPTVDTGRHSNELYAGVSLGGMLSPSLQVFYDLQEGHGTYISLGVSHDFSLAAKRVTLTPSMAIGYNDHQWIEGSGFSDLNLGLSLEVPVSRTIVQPFVNYSIGSDRLGLPSRFYGGISITIQ